jgi:hypothetical protein
VEAQRAGMMMAVFGIPVEIIEPILRRETNGDFHRNEKKY